jgi:hypothetical protein
MRTFITLVCAGLFLGACGGDDDDDGGGKQGGALGGILGQAFGSNGGPLNGGGGDTNGNANGEGDGNGQPAAGSTEDNCQAVCDRVFSCLNEGCPNYQKLPQATIDQGKAECVQNVCAQGNGTDAAVQQVRQATCQQITQELEGESADLATFCALEPASDEDCTSFCAWVDDCAAQSGGTAPSEEECRLSCFYGDAVRCVVHDHAGESCVAAYTACQGLFPASSDETSTNSATAHSTNAQ